MWLEILPPVVGENLDIIVLALLGLPVERKYISRLALWANVAAINIHLYENSATPDILVLYANVSVKVGWLALLIYESGGPPDKLVLP